MPDLVPLIPSPSTLAKPFRNSLRDAKINYSCNRFLGILGHSKLEELKSRMREVRAQPYAHQVETARYLLEAIEFEKWGTISWEGEQG